MQIVQVKKNVQMLATMKVKAMMRVMKAMKAMMRAMKAMKAMRAMVRVRVRVIMVPTPGAMMVEPMAGSRKVRCPIIPVVQVGTRVPKSSH